VADHLLNITDEISRTRSQQQTAQKFYPGELEQIHGKQEARTFIRKGKYRQVTDDQGDICYVKVTEREILTKDRKQTLSAGR